MSKKQDTITLSIAEASFMLVTEILYIVAMDEKPTRRLYHT